MIATVSDCLERIHTLCIQKPFSAASSLPRTGWVKRSISNPETVGEHQIQCAMMTYRFRLKIQEIGGNVGIIQDTLLIHDIAEPDPRVGDITPHCNISEEEKRRKEEQVIKEILGSNPQLLQFWFDYEDSRTLDGRLAKEIDKLQAIEKARLYEDVGAVPIGTTEEFFTYSVSRKKQIQTDFLLRYAIDLYESKPR